MEIIGIILLLGSGILLGVALSALYNKMHCSGLTHGDYDNLVANYSKANDNYLEQLRVTVELRERLIKEIELSLKIMLEKEKLVNTYKGLITEVTELKQKLSNCESSTVRSDRITALQKSVNNEVYA